MAKNVIKKPLTTLEMGGKIGDAAVSNYTLAVLSLVPVVIRPVEE